MIVGINLCVLLSFNVVGYLLGCKQISLLAAGNEANTYKIRSRLLMEAMKNIGACTPAAAVKIWAEGLKERSAAMQYSVMSSELKRLYAAQLEKIAPNWVTGISSPWIESYEIVNFNIPYDDRRIVELLFSTATSTGPAGEYKARLDISRINSFWQITEISADEALYPYTRFRP